jgi:hypothetical protein
VGAKNGGQEEDIDKPVVASLVLLMLLKMSIR